MTKPLPDGDAERTMATAVELRVQMVRLKRRLREQASSDDFTGSQIAVVKRLESDGPATTTSLARAEGMRPQSMGANVAVLEAAGLVGGVPDPADGRQTLWSLTSHCRDWIKAGRAAREDWLSRAIQATLSPAERDQLARAVDLLRRIADS
jgi:DNA-binding MarR family transcriptional regulator